MITRAFSGHLKMYNCWHNYFCAYTKQYIIIIRRHRVVPTYDIIIIYDGVKIVRRFVVEQDILLIDPVIRFFFPLILDNNESVTMNYNLLKSK